MRRLRRVLTQRRRRRSSRRSPRRPRRANWDISYTYGESQGSTEPTAPSTIVNCSPSLEVACPGSSGGLTSPQNVTVTGTGIINVNPKAMVTIANVSDFGRVVLRLNASDVWELLSGDSGGLAPDSSDAQTTGQSLAGYAGLVESTLGTREGAVAMLGIASPTGYLELDEQAIANVTPNGTATVNGHTVTKYTVAVQPSELASDPTASPDEVSAIQAALSTLATSGMSATTDQVAVDGQGFIIQSISTYEFSDGGWSPCKRTSVISVAPVPFSCLVRPARRHPQPAAAALTPPGAVDRHRPPAPRLHHQSRPRPRLPMPFSQVVRWSRRFRRYRVRPLRHRHRHRAPRRRPRPRRALRSPSSFPTS